VLLLCGLGLSLVSCYPGDDISPSQSDIVVTVPNPTADFSTKLTYARTPDVCEISDQNQAMCDSPPTLDASTVQQILTSIDANMTGMGFTAANPPDPTATSPVVGDVHIVPFATKKTWVGYTCYPYYWDYWYGDGYPPGYGWCYPYPYTFTTGTLLIVMLDPLKPTDSSPLWAAAINGLVSGSSIPQINQRVSNTINQAFKQSPYLGAGK
jgi:hypothetical protein